MFKTALIMAILSTTLAGCLSNDGQRALLGGMAGAVVADATGNDPLLGAGVGAGIGLIAH